MKNKIINVVIALIIALCFVGIMKLLNAYVLKIQIPAFFMGWIGATVFWIIYMSMNEVEREEKKNEK